MIEIVVLPEPIRSAIIRNRLTFNGRVGQVIDATDGICREIMLTETEGRVNVYMS